MKKRKVTTSTAIFQQDSFYDELDAMLNKAVQKHERLLFHKQEWSMEDACKQEIMDALENLSHRLLYRASLFAMHRSGTDNVATLKKQKIVLREDDLEMAWKTLDV